MKKNGKLNFPPDHPKVVAAVLNDLRALSPEELDAMLRRRPEGVEETDMNEEVAQWYRDQKVKNCEDEELKSKVA